MLGFQWKLLPVDAATQVVGGTPAMAGPAVAG